MDYNFLRQLADSWGLLYLVVLFVGIILFTFRPGSKSKAEGAAKIPFNEDNNNAQE